MKLCRGLWKAKAIKWVEDEFGAAGKIQFGDDAFGYGDFCISGAGVQSGSGQYYESCYLEMAGGRMLQEIRRQEQLQEIDAAASFS